MVFAKKSLGQNFLHEKKYLQSIRDALDPVADDIIFEIGPGTGNLTAAIVSFPATLIAIEKDPDMITELKRRFPQEIATQKLQLFEQDFLETDISEFFCQVIKSCVLSSSKTRATPQGLALKHVVGLQNTTFDYSHQTSYKIVGNIPYYITGLIVRHIFEQTVLPDRVVLLVQREVADRIVARDGKQSLLALSVQVYGQVEYVETVPRTAFTPAPKVDSAIISISNISHDRFISPQHEQIFFECIKCGFAHKRKLLLSNLKNSIQNVPIKITEQWLVDQNYSHYIRAEDVSLDSWIDLSKRFLQWYTDR